MYTEIAIQFCINGDPARIFRFTAPFGMVGISITQLKIQDRYVFSVVANGIQIFNEENVNPRSFLDVEAYISNPWDFPFNGIIRNMKILSL